MAKKQNKRTHGGAGHAEKNHGARTGAGRAAGTAARRLPRRFPPRVAPFATAEGIFVGTRNGYGFVEVEGREHDIFIPAPKTGGALDGDRVAVRYGNRFTGDKTDGEVVRILACGRNTVIGTLAREEFITHSRGKRGARYILLPDDGHLNLPLVVTDPAGAKPGDKVEALIGARRAGMTELNVSVLRVFGGAATREANYAAILADCEVPVDFSAEALDEARDRAAEPLSDSGRKRLSREVILTIDGADAKDLDDAVSLTVRQGGGWRLGVHIADVSHYVTPKTALDQAAMERGTSLYFVDQVVPMLPPALSNGACSLNPGTDKYALSAHIDIAPDGTLQTTTVERTVIRSRVRGVYSEVNDLFQRGEDSPFAEKYREVLPTLSKMHALYRVLARKSAARGALELEHTEARILLDERGMPSEILPRVRGDAEKMIEQFMLAANEGVATLLHEKGLPCVYRIHEKPAPEKVRELMTYAHNLGLDVSHLPHGEPTGRDFAAMLGEARERGIGTAMSYTLLRTMQKARYSESAAPHYGLGIDLYCHFTSPIRRLSDLATHRMISAVLIGGEAPGKYASYAARAARAASETELRALAAERRIEALYKTLYLSERIGEVYDATVSSVTSFGAFCELENTCEGLIPLSDLPGMWQYDEGNAMLRSAAGGTLRLGDRIRISVEEADVSRGKVRFALVAAAETKRAGTPENRTAARRAPSGKRTAARPANGQQAAGGPAGKRPGAGGIAAGAKHPARGAGRTTPSGSGSGKRKRGKK